MDFLTSPILYLYCRRVQNDKRTALHLLILSGVVRPSHIELRYTTPIARITAFRTQPTVIEHTQSQLTPSQSWDHNSTLTMKHARRWVLSLSSAIIQRVKKPIMLRWTKQPSA
jgi:hypothetical protein